MATVHHIYYVATQNQLWNHIQKGLKTGDYIAHPHIQKTKKCYLKTLPKNALQTGKRLP